MNRPLPALERRRDLALRLLFDQAYRRIEPFLDAAGAWGGAGFTLVIQHQLREAYPQLSAQQVQMLVIAAKRVHGQRRRTRPRAGPAARPATRDALSVG